MKRTADNAQKRPLAILGRRDYAELPSPNQGKQADTNCRFPRFWKSGDEGRADKEHRPSMGRGGSRIFSTHTYTQMYTWCIFRLRQFWKSERHTDQKVSVVPWRSLSPKWSLFLCKLVLPILWMILWLWLALQIFAVTRVRSASARQVTNRTQQVLVTWVGVDGGGENRLVPGKTLGDPNVPSAAIEIRTGRMPQGVKAESAVEPGSLLPYAKGMAKLASGESIAFTADEYRSMRLLAFAPLIFPAIEFSQFGADAVRQDNLLVASVVTTAFEDVELHTAFGLALGIEDIAHIQSDDLVFPKSRAQGKTEDDVISKPRSMFSADLEQKTLLQFGEGLGWSADRIGIVHGMASSRFFVPLTWGRAIAGIARESAVIIEAQKS